MARRSAQPVQPRQRPTAQFTATRGTALALDPIFIFPFKLLSRTQSFLPTDGKFLRCDGIAFVAIGVMTHGVSQSVF